MERGAPTVRTLAAWGLVASAWAAVLWADAPPAALAFALASRAAYVLYVGLSLRARAAEPPGAAGTDPREAWRRFRRTVPILMNNDGVAIVLAAWVGRGSLDTPLPPWVLPSLGGVFILAGLSVKYWALAVLPPGAWWWRGCFLPEESEGLVTSGPYRWFRNPMYTAGYLQAYGPALILGSLPGLLAAAFAQGAILLMNAWAERPHTRALSVQP